MFVQAIPQIIITYKNMLFTVYYAQRFILAG